jgi:hypothetical protein
MNLEGLFNIVRDVTIILAVITLATILLHLYVSERGTED